MYYEGN